MYGTSKFFKISLGLTSDGKESSSEEGDEEDTMISLEEALCLGGK